MTVLMQHPQQEALAALDAWLVDALRSGLDAIGRDWPARAEPIARRLVDARLRGLSDRVLGAPAAWDGTAPASPDRRRAVAGALGQLRLISSGLRRGGDPATQAELTRLAAAAPRRDALLRDPNIRVEPGLWRSAGRRRHRRWDGLYRVETWLRRESDAMPALIVSYDRDPEVPPTTPIAPGLAYDGAVAFFAGPSPLRAVLADAAPEHMLACDAPPAPSNATLGAALESWRQRMIRTPWRGAGPVEAGDLRFNGAPEDPALIAPDGVAAPLEPGFPSEGRAALAALSAEAPLSALGLWDGAAQRFRPLAAWNMAGLWTRPQ